MSNPSEKDFNIIHIRHSADNPDLMQIELSLLDENGIQQTVVAYQKKQDLYCWLLVVSAALFEFFHENKT